MTNGMKVLEFPEGRHVGILYAVDIVLKEEKVSIRSVGLELRETKLGPARGRVAVPANRHLLLSMAMNSASDLSALACLPPDALNAIYLPGVPLTGADLRPIAHIESILYVACNSMDYAPAHKTSLDESALELIASLPFLRYLSLCDAQITDASVATLERLTNLELLSLSGNNISDEGARIFGNMLRLEVLHLSRTGITNGVLPFLAALKNLKEVDFSRTSLTPEAIGHFLESHPGCHHTRYFGSYQFSKSL
ncbi:MAG TPA: hypothetical protein V6D17_00100 [Candidatus Obscuribacterales bacterium]